MSEDAKRFIRREIIARRETLIGTVVSDQILVAYDTTPAGAQTWVVDVDVGSNRILRDVMVKAGTRGRFYAQRGQTVSLRRNAQGRFDVIGPADRTVAGREVRTYDLNAAVQVGSTASGFQVVVRAFEFFAGARSMKGAPSVVFDAGGQTLTRSAGSWLVDNFTAGGGDSVRIAGTQLNNGVRTTVSASALVLTLSSGVVSEAAAEGVSVGVVGTSRWNDGVTGFPARDIIDLSTGLPV